MKIIDFINTFLTYRNVPSYQLQNDLRFFSIMKNDLNYNNGHLLALNLLNLLKK